MITEAIILAGGLGTRLRSAVPHLPKCMAPVAGRPFLHYLITYFQGQGVERFVFSLGYRHELINDFLATAFAELPAQFTCVVEEEPLGTGGAVLLSAQHLQSDAALVLNGDTFFEIDLATLSGQFDKTHADCVLSLKPMMDMERYGVVNIASDNRIISFQEKKFYPQGLINGGVYALNIPSFLNEGFSEKFSFEKDYLEKYFANRNFYGSVQQGYFIDIGIPEDYHKANKDFETKCK